MAEAELERKSKALNKNKHRCLPQKEEKRQKRRGQCEHRRRNPTTRKHPTPLAFSARALRSRFIREISKTNDSLFLLLLLLLQFAKRTIITHSLFAFLLREREQGRSEFQSDTQSDRSIVSRVGEERISMQLNGRIVRRTPTWSDARGTSPVSMIFVSTRARVHGASFGVVT